MSQSDSSGDVSRSPHYFIEADSADDPIVCRVYDLSIPGEPVVYGPTSYPSARKWCIEHGDPEAAE